MLKREEMTENKKRGITWVLKCLISRWWHPFNITRPTSVERDRFGNYKFWDNSGTGKWVHTIDEIVSDESTLFSFLVSGGYLKREELKRIKKEIKDSKDLELYLFNLFVDIKIISII